MRFRDLPIKRKVMSVIMLTSVTVVVLSVAAFMVYELLIFRQAIARNLAVTAAITADNSTAALAFRIQRDASETLAALRAEPHIEAAALYDDQGKLFVRYPERLPTNAFPQTPPPTGRRFEGGKLILVRPVAETETEQGTLYIRSDLGALHERMRLYGIIAGAVLCGAIIVAFLLSEALQKRISQPILALAETARTITQRGDYSVRAEKLTADEVGLLTEAFNRMLARIEEQTRALAESEKRKSAMLDSALDCIITMDQEGRIVDFNPAAEKLFGYRKVDVQGKTVAEKIIPERLQSAHSQGLARFKQTGEGPVLGRRLEMPAIRADGVEFPVEMSITPTPMDGGSHFFTCYLRDITDRKQTEERLSFLGAIVETSDDAVVGKDLEGRVLSWNRGAERMFGYTSAEMVGESIMRIVSPDRPEEESRILREVLTGETRHFETVRVRKDGEHIEVALTISPIRNARGEIIGISSIARDITAHNRAVRELHRSEAQFRLIWENVLDGMRLTDEQGNILLVNEAYCRLVEKSRAELEGKTIAAAYDPNREKQILEQHRKRFSERGVAQHSEREITLWNGKKVHLETSNSFLELPNQSAMLVSTFRDISSRKQAEAREAAFAKLARKLSEVTSAGAAARVIAETASDLMGWDACSLDLYSPETDHVTPVINIDTVSGLRLDVAPAYGNQPPSPIVRQVLAHGGQLVLRQEPFQFSPGVVPFGNTSRPSASLMYVPIRLGEKVIGILSIQSYTPRAYREQDLATLQTLADQCSGALERVRAAEEVRKLNAELEQRVLQRTAELSAANREMEAFTYSVAHDLRAPLRHINAFARILHEDYGKALGDEGNQFLENIQSGSRNMSQLVDDLLNLARIGRQELKREPTALKGLVETTVEELKRETTERQIDFRIEPLPVAQCDPGLMKVVFSNLLSNAIKYTRPRPTAKVEIGAQKHNGGTAVFVRDNGVGFDMRYANKLFGVFQRLHRPEDFEGTGVGLATVDRIIRKHGGKVWAEAEVDKGATFYFTLPGLGGQKAGT
jgi:PAS domain S-box-containing protein